MTPASPAPPRMALMPRWLASLSADGKLAGYRLRLGWNGRHALAPARVPAGERCIVVVDSALPFRRKLQRFPDTRKARLALLRAAPEEFPLPAEEVLYGLGLRGADAYLYALPRRVLEEFAGRGLRPAIVLVAGFGAEAEPAACLAAFEAYLGQGDALDLLRAGRYVSRRRLLQVQLGAAFGVALLAGAALLLVPGLSAGVLEWRAAALREKGSALPKLYRVTENMAQAQAEAAKLYASPEARLPGILGALFGSVPPGRSLRSIELKDGTLRITGAGGGVKNWLVPIGFPPERIVEQQAGSLQQFSAERPL
jgi:hypothetical protein